MVNRLKKIKMAENRRVWKRIIEKAKPYRRWSTL